MAYDTLVETRGVALSSAVNPSGGPAGGMDETLTTIPGWSDNDCLGGGGGSGLWALSRCMY